MDVIEHGSLDYISEFGNTYNSRYFKKYLSDIKLNPITVVVEDHYIDRQYLVDYSHYYSRSFNIIPKHTTRYHFFNANFDKSDLLSWLADYNSLESWLEMNKISNLSEIYIGYIIVKPVPTNGSDRLIGRAALRPYDGESIDEEDAHENIFVTFKQTISLYGLELSLETLPFQPQDKCVGACASAAIWATNYSLNSLFRNPPIRSLSEITKISSRFFETSRSFPSNGLSIEQMVQYYKQSGLDAGYCLVDPFKKDSKFVWLIIQSFIEMRNPIIGAIELMTEEGLYGRHAVVISGYRSNKEKTRIERLYVHDDQWGPFCSVKSVNGDYFYEWSYEWDKEKDSTITEIKLLGLIIPYYEKIRLTPESIYKSQIIREHISFFKSEGYELSFHLVQIKDYKKTLLEKSFNVEIYKNGIKVSDKSKIAFLTDPLPRFLWIMRAYKGGIHIMDLAFDASELYSDELFGIFYNSL